MDLLLTHPEMSDKLFTGVHQTVENMSSDTVKILEICPQKPIGAGARNPQQKTCAHSSCIRLSPFSDAYPHGTFPVKAWAAV